jgi:hypothetical protein
MSLFDEKVEITKATLIEINRALKALAEDKNSYVHKVFSDDYCFQAFKEIEQLYKETFPKDK